MRQAGTQTFVQFDFTGLHDICLADRSVVTGIVEGHLVQRIWQSHVMTVGDGTGPLAGIHGQGTFVFTGPASLADVIYYVYTP